MLSERAENDLERERTGRERLSEQPKKPKRPNGTPFLARGVRGRVLDQAEEEQRAGSRNPKEVGGWRITRAPEVLSGLS